MELTLFIFKITQNYIVIFCKIIKRKQTSKINQNFACKVLPANIKPMNPMQKYPHIIELFDCILNMFVFMLCLINLSISLGTCSTPKLLK